MERMKVEEFDFYLPKELIALEPIKERDKCKLLVVHRDTGRLEDKIFRDILEYVEEGDCIVLNDTKVIKARLFGVNRRTGKEHEVVLIESDETKRVWKVLIRRARKVKKGDILIFPKDIEGKVIGREEELRVIEFSVPIDYELLEEIGKIPLPPYIVKGRIERGETEKAFGAKEDEEFYQTVYSRVYGSVASPTAGLHFTPELLKALESKGVNICYVTLHVGIGTFKPIDTENVEDYKIHKEYIEVSEESARKINETKERGRKIIAVGTTVVRTLETVGKESGKVEPYRGYTDLYIYPGYKFKVVDRLITNFHLPKSSLIVLVCAFGGKELIMNAYKYAIEKRYRFYSYGDAMLIL